MPSLDILPQASPGRERFALEIFPLNLAPEEYAARKGHLWASFTFDAYVYRDIKLNEWVHRFGDIYAERNGAPSIPMLRATHLSAEELTRIEEGYHAEHPVGHYPKVLFTSFTRYPGKPLSRHKIDSAQRDCPGVNFFHVLLEQRIADFSMRLGPENTIQLDWTDVEGDCALASFIKEGIPLTTSALICGRSPAKDDSVLRMFEQIVADTHQIWNYPVDQLGAPIRERPAIITAILPSALVNHPDNLDTMQLIGTLETNLAAAYFEQRQVVPVQGATSPWWSCLLKWR